MKKVKLILLSIFVLGVLAVNILIVGNRTNGFLTLSSLIQIANAQEELPEVTITCDSGGQGVCYESCNEFQVYCNGLWLWEWDCQANGDPNTWCVPFDPC